MFEESPPGQKQSVFLHGNEQHLRRRVQRLKASLQAALFSTRWRSRPLERNLRLLRRCGLTLMPTKLTSATRKAYWQCYLRRKSANMLNPASTVDGRATCLRTWRYNRAALKFGFANELLAWLDTPHDLQLECFGPTYDVDAECRVWMRWARQLLRYAPPGVRVDSQRVLTTRGGPAASARHGALAAVNGRRPVELAPSTSKRVGLSNLGSLWRQQFWQNVRKGAQHRSHIAALILTGARPCEFENHMRVRLMASAKGDQLVFLIRGRKKTITTGLSWRRVIVDVKTAQGDKNRADAVHHLVSRLRNEPRQRMNLMCKAKALHAAVSAVGARAFPHHDYKIAPYSFRHQLATDIKASDLGEVEFARILSHASTRTADHYGFAARGRRAANPVQTLSVRSGGARGQVRVKHSEPPNWPSVRSVSSSMAGKRHRRP